jgi:autoinducer 2-degrading protein
MSKVAVLARLKAKEGKGDELIAALRPVMDAAEKEPGTLLYILHRAKDDPDMFWISEMSADEASFAAHGQSEAMAAAGPALMALLDEPQLTVGEPLSGKGLPA